MGKKSKILVMGDVILDHYINGSCNRISPEAPVPVIELQDESWVLGGAANVANNLIDLGSEVYLCSIIGDDKNGDLLIELLDQKGIQKQLIKSDLRKTSIKTRVVSGAHHLVRIDSEDKNKISSEDEDKILDMILSIIDNCNCILLSDYNKGLLTDRLIKEVIEIAKTRNIKVLVDPKNPPFSKYSGADLIKPNKKEAFLETGINICDAQSLNDACRSIYSKYPFQTIIITLSEDGVAIFQNQELKIIPTKAKEIFDVTGAGDTFLAALAFGINIGYDIYTACEFANNASAIVISKHGCSTTNFNEIENLIRNNKPI